MATEFAGECVEVGTRGVAALPANQLERSDVALGLAQFKTGRVEERQKMSMRLALLRRRRLQMIKTIFSRSAVAYQPCLLEPCKLGGNIRLAQGKDLLQLRHGKLLMPQKGEDAHAGGIAEKGE
jgi:hypothetical protein